MFSAVAGVAGAVGGQPDGACGVGDLQRLAGAAGREPWGAGRPAPGEEATGSGSPSPTSEPRRVICPDDGSTRKSWLSPKSSTQMKPAPDAIDSGPDCGPPTGMVNRSRPVRRSYALTRPRSQFASQMSVAD